MKVIGDYYGSGYAHLRGLMSPQIAHEILAQVKRSVDATPQREWLFREQCMLRRPALEIDSRHYRLFGGLLFGLTSTICEVTGRKLTPTYSYGRIYRKGDVCLIHSDRNACEYSLSLTLGYSDDKRWSFEIANQKLTELGPVAESFDGDAYSAIEMAVGDAVLYQGIHRRHGRLTPNPNTWSAHLFLHWVDSEGDWKDEAFDGQATEALVDFSASAVGDPTGPLGTDAP